MGYGSARGYGSTPGATSKEQAVISRLTEAERRVDDPWGLEALGDGLDLLRQLIVERGRRRYFEDDMEAADHEDWAPACDDFDPDPPAPDF